MESIKRRRKVTFLNDEKISPTWRRKKGFKRSHKYTRSLTGLV